jgi:hypothetical protein
MSQRAGEERSITWGKVRPSPLAIKVGIIIANGGVFG